MSDDLRVRSGGAGSVRAARPPSGRLRLVEGGAETHAPASGPVPDGDLVAAIAAGDEQAFEELYRRYFHELYDYAARVTRDRTAAADVVQGVFATAWERMRRGDQIRAPRAWLYRLAHNAAVDELRRRGKVGESGDHDFDFAAVEDTGASDPARAAMEHELAELVWSTAETLDRDEYDLLDLHVRRDLPPEELADELGISRGALYTRMSRLRRSFEDALTVRLLTRRGGDGCPVLAELVDTLGARADESEGRRLLAAHIRDCGTCQAERRRHVNAEALLASLALVPITPGTAEAVWAKLCALLGLGAGAAGAAGSASGGAAQQGHLTGALAHPVVVAVAATALAIAAGAGVWAARNALHGSAAAPAAQDPSRVWSRDHAVGRASRDRRVEIVWSRQPTAAAYSVLWSRVPRQEPDAVPDLPGRATGATSPALAPGRWWFHLRTEGRDGTWTDTVHLGPFVILARASTPGKAAPAPSPTGGSNAAHAASGGTTAAPPASQPGPQQTTPATSGGPPAASTTPTAGDSTPPHGQSVELAGGRYYRTLSVPLVLRNGSDAGSGLDPATGVVQRSTATLAGGSCGGWSGTWTTVALRGSADTGVANGRCYRYRYRVSDRAGNASGYSATSAVAAVDTTPPTRPALALTEGRPDAYASGTTIFYRPSGNGGTFTVAATSTDRGSGLVAVEFPGLGRGMAPAVATRRPTAPYRVDYTWQTGADESGTFAVTAFDRAGNTAVATFTIVRDAVGPAGLSVAPSGGQWFTRASVPLVIDPGSDAGSGEGVGSAAVERDRAALAGGRCGAFAGTWEPVSLQDGVDGSVGSGSCYRYRYSVSDNVGNRSSSAPSAEARIDTTPPAAPRLTLTESSDTLFASGATLYYRPGKASDFRLSATTADPDSGIAAVSFPTVDGALGGGVDRTAPYETGYSSTSGLTTSGARAVVARNGAGATARRELELQPDGAAPTGMSVRLSTEPWPAGSVALVVDSGADAGSGVDPGSLLVERDTAPLDGTGCGTYAGAWTPVELDGAADTTVEGGHCYRYRVRIADNVGNTAVSDPSGDARMAMSTNVSFFSGGGGGAGWLPRHSGIQLTVPATGAYAGITLHHFDTASAPSTEPTFTTDNFAAGSPRWVVEFEDGSVLFGYPAPVGKWEVEGCAGFGGPTYYDYGVAVNGMKNAHCGGGVTAVYIVADGSSGVFPELDTITSIQYDGREYVD